MISLRDYSKGDAQRLVELANNENVSRYLIDTFPYPYTMEDAVWWIESGSGINNSVTKVIELDGIFIGSIGMTPQQGWKHHSAEIGYWLGQDYWGKGLAVAALQIMSSLCFSELKVKRLFAPVLAPNKASMRVLEKCGYQLEGKFIKEVYKNGRFYDVYYYAKTC